MITINNCPVCNSTNFTEDLICKDYTVSGELFRLVVCNDCEFKFTNPRPSNDVLGNYYKSENYISHTNTKKGLISKLYHIVRNFTLRAKISLIDKYVSRGTILDYGCGTGMFLNLCRQSGWRSFGIEPDDGARRIAVEMNLNVYREKDSITATHPEILFDAITLWHVLEHVTDVEEALKFFKTKLKPHGILVIAVPNHKSFDANLYKQFWAAYDVPRHLYHFHKETIQSLMAKYDFKLTTTHPMKFDSFYVSMLSEKYKSGSVRYLKAFLAGLRSNLNAASTQEYSSRIYVFMHK